MFVGRLGRRSSTCVLFGVTARHCSQKTARSSANAAGVLPRWRDSTAWGDSFPDTHLQFGTFAKEYNDLRPGYPDAVFHCITTLAVSRLDDGELSTVSQNTQRRDELVAIDVACGTGRCALALASQSEYRRVTATDSDPQMLQAATGAATEMDLQADLLFAVCPAETLTASASSVDVITVFQAFHWFSEAEALAEFSRVLKPRGLLFCGWNDRDITVPWVLEFERLIEKHNPRFDHRAKQSDLWRPVLSSGGHFRVCATNSASEGGRGAHPLVFPHHVHYDNVEAFLSLTRTFSYVENAMSDGAKQRFTDDVKALVADAHGVDSFVLPYTTKLYALENTKVCTSV
eukprot:m.43383 g.43383  ORF g.43383 m.43383 type:complete len:345 (+) comp14698_c0_seq1:320-1354(+)